MVGYTNTKTHIFSILQNNAHSYKAFRILQMLTTDTISFSLLVIALHANNLRMFLTNVVIAGAACLSAFFDLCFFHKDSIRLSLPSLPGFRLQQLFFSVALRLNYTPFLH